MKSKFKKINASIHLWLGLISGLIVVNSCITGCIWIFNDEINDLLKPETRIEWQEKPILLPSQLKDIAQREYPAMKVSNLSLREGKAVTVGLGERKKANVVLYLNPYTGDVVRREAQGEGETDFFRFILNGHRFLWLPSEIGRPIVNYATLAFVVILITGLIWWWPKKWNKSTRERVFKIKWGASFKRVNIDLHNVLGFYALLVLLSIALTGMVWGLKWYSRGLYWITSGGISLPKQARPKSDSLQANKFYTYNGAIDQAFAAVMRKHPKAAGFFYSLPDTSKATSVISITVYANPGQFYRNQSYQFDRHTLKPLKNDAVSAASFEEASFATRLRKMNYDIHIGTVLGLPGKVLVFCCTLIGASLPVTGFLIWWGRKFGKKKKRKSIKKEQRGMVTTKEEALLTAEQQPEPVEM